MRDLIDRQAAIDVYGDWYVEEGTAEGFIGTVKQLLEGLPSAQPEPCDVCRYNPPSSGDGKPCTICPAKSWKEGEQE